MVGMLFMVGPGRDLIQGIQAVKTHCGGFTGEKHLPHGDISIIINKSPACKTMHARNSIFCI